MGRVVLDTSVVIALLEGKNERHSMAVEHFGNEINTYILSAVTIAEVLVRPSQLGTAADAVKSLKRFADEIIDLDFELAAQAAQIRASKYLKLPDAIISATAQAARATLVTFDAKLAKAHKGSVLLG